MRTSTTARYAAVAFALIVYLGLTVAASRAKTPWSDEGSLASPAYNLATRGFMGTTIYGANFLPGLEQHTYYLLPFGIATQAMVYKIFGFSLLSMRIFSVFCGMLAVAAWYLIVRKVSGHRAVAYLAGLILISDYLFLMGASFGRLDVICMAWGSAGLAAYLTLRERSLVLALLVGHTAVVMSGLTHPLGLLYFFGLCFLMILYDGPRVLSVKPLLACAIPYVIGAVGWGLYILQSPPDFMSQFAFGLGVGDRGSTLHNPWNALWAEIHDRYMRAFGLREHNQGSAGPIFLKGLVLLAYIFGVTGSIAIPGVRRSRAFKPLFGLTAIFFILMTLVEGQRLSVYLVHIIPLYSALLAMVVYQLVKQRTVPRVLAGITVAGLVLLQLGGVVLQIRNDPYHKTFLPAMQFVQAQVQRGELIMGESDLGFALGFGGQVVDDNTLGYRTGRTPDWVVVEEHYQQNFPEIQSRDPVAYANIQRVLAAYSKVYDQGGYAVYRRPRA